MHSQRLATPMPWTLTLLALGAPLAAQTATPATVTFDQLPAEWTVQQNPMDEIWRPIGLRGVNYFAFGGPAAPHTFAERSDPASPLYQAWLGAYVVIGGLDSATADDQARQRDLIARLTQYDQRGWLAAMGDTAPVADLVGPLHPSQIVIDGGTRTLFAGEMRTHSDLSVAHTPLAQSLGMPPRTSWPAGLAPFHDLTLHVQGAIWYDPARHVTIVVYGASSAFTTGTGGAHDNGPALDDLLRRLMGRAHVVDPPAAGSR